MKIVISLILAALLAFAAGCAPRDYTVTVADGYPLANEPEESYPAGEEVTILLYTVTERCKSVAGDYRTLCNIKLAKLFDNIFYLLLN